jgi:hypothetical protein
LLLDHGAGTSILLLLNISIFWIMLNVVLCWCPEIDALDDQNHTLLWNSIKKKNQEFVECLLERGANADFIGKLNDKDINLFQVVFNI